MPEIRTHASTLIDALDSAIRAAAAYDPNTQAAPACVLWTDEKEEWLPLIPRLRSIWPHLLTLGEYDLQNRTGPAIWIKTVLGRSLPEVELPDEVIPVIYLPGMGRGTLRAAESLPKELRPLAELQHRGVFFSQYNGKDWTILSFLVSENGGLMLDVARDNATVEAMSRALPELADLPVRRIIGHRLEAEDFNALLAPDPIRDVLKWLDDPEVFKEEGGAKRWAAFRAVCKERFKFDPEKSSVLEAATRLGFRKGNWAEVWNRYTEAPHRYVAVPERLRQSKPGGTGDLFTVSEPWPQDNEREETVLRASLAALDNVTRSQAIERVRQLEAHHGIRRNWVWAELGKAPLAHALKHLAALAEVVEKPIAGSTPEACGQAYREWGWKSDDAFIRALSSADTLENETAIKAAAVALYRPWLEESATAFDQTLQGDLPPQPEGAGSKPEAGCVWLFVDALRYDVGMRLAGILESSGFDVAHDFHWTAFPPLTPTSKPAASPVTDLINKKSKLQDFAPEVESGQLTPPRFRKLLEDRGFQVLSSDEDGDPSGSAWTEIGVLDKRGHELGWKLAFRIEEIIKETSARIRALLRAGWREVRIVTDHGWLLLPGGLPKTELPGVLTNVRWGRCAEIKAGSHTDLPTHGWYWNKNIQIAVARGAHVLYHGLEYTHGGITLQECLVPKLSVSGGAKATGAVQIGSVDWVGLRCRVEVEGIAENYKADIRLYAPDPGSSVTTSPKTIEEGKTSLIVPDDTLEGREAFIVIIDAEGNLVQQEPTKIGE